MDEIRMAVVGLGTRGRHSWLSALQKLSGFRITAICDPIAALCEQAAARLEHPEDVRVHTQYEDVLADENVDAIALTVRCREQGALAAQALEAGKHVNSEVPAAHTMEDCWRIVVAQERSGLVYQLAEQARYAGYIDAWQKMVAAGELGHITYCEGQYFHYYVGKSFQDPETGEQYGPAEGDSHQGLTPGWMHDMPPIHYLPHDLSPMLKVLDDRVVEVMAMGTDPPSAAHPQLPTSDMQAALMKTEKGAVMRMAASFAQPHPERNTHWQQVIGTRGSVEWRRSSNDKPKMWLANSQMFCKAEVDWRHERTDAPPEARGSGHSDMDYYVHVRFRDAVLKGEPLEFDVYRAMDATAPAILAAESIAQDGKKLKVPNFRPSPERRKGEFPQ